MNKIKLIDVDKNYLVNESKTFCMFPWTHLNATPKGDIYPCCSNDYTNPIGNTADLTLKEAINTDYMKDLRLNMLADNKSDICTFCYNHEKAGPFSFRTYSLEHFGHYFDECIENTNEDGTLDEFKMRYYDIRFSNICNFKCRTCGSEFSSQWAIEDKKVWNPDGPILIHVDNEKGAVLEEILDQIDHIDLAYFAGGEPLITPEHYVIIEELIRRGKTNTTLRYNTNASNLIYKDKEILELWKHFDKVEVSCSIDSWGERAEVLRHGTDWGKVESNLKILRAQPNIDFQYNTVFSIFNYLTITEFYEYLASQDLLDFEMDWHHSLYLAVHPPHYSARALPKHLKTIAQDKITSKYTREANCVGRLMHDAINFANEEDTWEQQKEQFFHMCYRLNGIRQEEIFNTFPELKPLEDL